MTTSTLEKRIKKELRTEVTVRKQAEKREAKAIKNRPTNVELLRKAFPFIFDGEWKECNGGVTFYVKGEAYTLRSEYYSDPGTPTEGYGPTSGFQWVLWQGWNRKALLGLHDVDATVDADQVAKNETYVVDAIKRDLAR